MQKPKKNLTVHKIPNTNLITHAQPGTIIRIYLYIYISQLQKIYDNPITSLKDLQAF